MTTNYEAQMDRFKGRGGQGRAGEVMTGSAALMDTLEVSPLHGERDQVSPS